MTAKALRSETSRVIPMRAPPALAWRASSLALSTTAYGSRGTGIMKVEARPEFGHNLGDHPVASLIADRRSADPPIRRYLVRPLNDERQGHPALARRATSRAKLVVEHPVQTARSERLSPHKFFSGHRA